MSAEIVDISGKRRMPRISIKSPLTIEAPVTITLPADLADVCTINAGMFGKTVDSYVADLVRITLNMGGGR